MSKVVFAPAGHPFESAASWLSRVALSQGAQLRELLRYLPVQTLDLDLEFVRPEVAAACEALGLEPGRLVVAKRIFSNFQRAKLDPRRFLLYGGRRPRYRFCPQCFAEGDEVTIPVHWRFACWRVCPVHECVLRDGCGSCGAPILLPASMVQSGADKKGVAYLTSCLRCGTRLGRSRCLSVANLGLQRWELDLLGNGRAVLAALYEDKVLLEKDERTFSLRRLTLLDRSGLLPNRPEFLGPLRIEELLGVGAD